VSRPLVLLHGFTGSEASWAEVRRLAARDDVFAATLLGHDGSPGPASVRTFTDEVDRLARAVTDRGFSGAVVAGYSMGGRVALGLLVRHPGLFSAAALLGASPGLSDPGERASRRRQDEERARLLETEGVGTFVAAWEGLPLFATQGGVDPAALEAQRRVRLSHDPHGLARALRVLGLAAMPDYGPALGGVEVPVRVVAGEWDGKFVALGWDLAHRLPAGTLHVVAGAGHNVVLENPAEIARLLKELAS
jgi:2-succinyl-6-hydroxy-2,4-cyclohexadiene-1-carboxylate synthase